jgi:NADH-quinone oxidoreductase subunit J
MLGFPSVVAILAVLATVILHAQGLGVATLGEGLTNAQGSTNIEELSTVLFTRLLLPFEVTSVLILIAILGAVALARHGDGDPNGKPTAEKELERTAAK